MPLVAGYEVLGVTGFGHGEQEVVGWIAAIGPRSGVDP